MVHLRAGFQAQALRCIHLRSSYRGEAGLKGIWHYHICGQSHIYLELESSTLVAGKTLDMRELALAADASRASRQLQPQREELKEQ